MSARFLNVHELSDLLGVNEKKIYQMASDGLLPGTKITGKWLFPLNLIEQWIAENSHGGVMADRLLISGADDVLLHRLCQHLNQRVQPHQSLLYSPCSSREGLALLARGRVEACLIHWSQRGEQSDLRHQALLRGYANHRQWVLVRVGTRHQGLMCHPKLAHSDFDPRRHPAKYWRCRQADSGSQRAFSEYCAEHQLHIEAPVCHSERALAGAIHSGLADIGPGSRAAALEHGLHFIPLSHEVMDLVTPKAVYFRRLFQDLLDAYRHLPTEWAAIGDAYDVSSCGERSLQVD